MPGAERPLLCTRRLNKRYQILSIRIAQDETDRKCRERPRTRSTTLKNRGNKERSTL